MRPIALLCLLVLGVAAPARAALLPPGAPLSARFAEALVQQALEAIAAGEQFRIIVDQPPLPLDNAATLATEVTLEQFQYDPTAGRFHGALVGTFEGHERFRLPIFGRAYPVIRAPTLRRPLGRRQVIVAAGLTWVEVAEARMPRDGLTGGQTRGRLAASRVPTERDLGPRNLVRRGRPVELIYARPGLRITALGVAQEDGALGDLVRVMNAESRRQLQGVVSGLDEVSFGASGPIVAR